MIDTGDRERRSEAAILTRLALVPMAPVRGGTRAAGRGFPFTLPARAA